MVTPKQPIILVVDDDSDLLRLMKRGFEQKGYTVVARRTAPDKAEVDRIGPSVIFMDVGLGAENGAALCHALKRGGSATGQHVVLISGHPQNILEVEAASALADGCITKPFKMGALTDLATYYAPLN